ncbi:pentapeptide repeat-containing protein [Aquimarina rhabdastrellae]
MNQEDQIKNLLEENKELREELSKITSQKEQKKKMRKWLFKKSSTPLLGAKLKNSIEKAIQEYKEKQTVSVDTVSEVASNVIWRFTRIGVFTILMGLIPSLVLLVQTKLLLNQNSLIENQNKRVFQQTHLVEADRRSSLSFIMGDLLSDLNEELRYKGIGDRNISKTLEARIVGLCMAMKPYRYIQGDELIKKPVSQERGQLLYSLIKSNLTKTAFQRILNDADFEYSDLQGINIGSKVSLRYARLAHSNMADVFMPEANLKGADLKYSELERVNLSDGNLTKVDLENANAANADLLSVNLTNANLKGTNLSKANLSEAILWQVKLSEDTDMTDVVLDNAIVDRKDWVAYVADSLEIKGAETIEDRYQVKRTYEGKKQFTIVAKK